MNFKKVFKTIRKPNVLVIGDIMLDTFIIGKHAGKSPEGPIPLIKKKKEYSTAGAAALVALCVNKIGGQSFLIGGLGNEQSAGELKFQLKKNKVKRYIVTDRKSVTTNKVRIFSDQKALLRLDCESSFSISKEKKMKLKKIILTKMKSSNVIIVSDYGKGFCSKEILKFIIINANKLQIPMLLDTRKNAKDFNIYKNSYCIKPNFFEAKSIYKNLKRNDKSLKKCSHLFKKNYKIKNIIITLGGDGSTLLDENNNFYHFRHKKRKNIDVTGAGDNFISSLAVVLCLTKNLKMATNLSNNISGIAVEKFGTYVVTKKNFYSAIKRNKI